LAVSFTSSAAPGEHRETRGSTSQVDGLLGFHESLHLVITGGLSVIVQHGAESTDVVEPDVAFIVVAVREVDPQRSHDLAK
jgi:hypothetical protein